MGRATGVPFAQIQRTLMGLGTMATINSTIDAELAEMVAAELGLDLEFKQPETLEDKLLEEIKGQVFASETLAEFWPELDEFEGTQYSRVPVEAVLTEGGTVEAYVYVLSTN